MPDYFPAACGAQCHRCPIAPGGPLARDEWLPVPPQDNGSSILAVAEMPSDQETRSGQPLAGRSGIEWGNALEAIGLKRNQIDIDHVVACQPRGPTTRAWKRMETKLDQINQERSARNEPIWAHPEECCRPRLLWSASAYSYIIALGKTSTRALTGQSRSMENMRGDLMMVDASWQRTMDDAAMDRKVAPLMHPSFVGRSPSWRGSLHSDLGKALRWFRDALRWSEPQVFHQPSPDQLRAFLSESILPDADSPVAKPPFWVYDLETDGIEVETTRIRTIGIAIPDLKADGSAALPTDSVAQVARAVVVNLLSADLGKHHEPNEWNPHDPVPAGCFYSAADEAQIIALLVGALTSGRKWFGHNARSFDRQVVEAQWGVTPKNVDDTLFGARFRAPDLPKSLKTTGSILLDVERWETTEKGDKIVMGFDDHARAVYCGLDCVVNARLVPILLQATRAKGALRPLRSDLRPTSWLGLRPTRGSTDRHKWNLYESDHLCQDMCVELHKNGVYVNEERRLELVDHYQASVVRRKERLSNIAEFIDVDDDPCRDGAATQLALNPNAYGQIRELLYTIWKLECPASMDIKDFYTESGLPGTGDGVLRAHLASGNLTDQQADFVQELRLYRREQNKVLATTLLPLRQKSEGGVVWPDGRVRSSWNAHVTSVGRLSCSGPNLQNIGGRKGMGALKSVFSAAPGNYLVGSDLDQAHLKIIANIWKIPLLRECFMDGKDPHSLLAYAIFGNRFKNAEGWAKVGGFSLIIKPPKGSKALAMREIAKTFRYASIYWASPATVWQVLTSTETGGAPNEYELSVYDRLKARLPYYDFKKRDVYLFHKKWLAAEPEWFDAWQNCLDDYQLRGYMEEPVLGRRSGGLSDGKKNEVVNYEVLAAEGSIMRLAEAAIIAAYPFRGPAGLGLIHQCHDSVALELRAPAGFDAAGWVRAAKIAKMRGQPAPELPAKVERARRIVEEAMCVKIPGWDIPITAEADVGHTLSDV